MTKNDQTTKKSKKHKTKWYCFEPNIWSNINGASCTKHQSLTN